MSNQRLVSLKVLSATILLGALSFQSVRAQTVVRDVDATRGLQQRWDHAKALGANSGATFAVGFSFKRLMSEDHYFRRSLEWSMYTNGDYSNDHPSLMQIATGRIPPRAEISTAEAVQRTARMVLAELGRIEYKETVTLREIGFVLTYRDGVIADLWLGNIELGADIDAPTLYWVGASRSGEATPLLLGEMNIAERTANNVAARGATPSKKQIRPISGIVAAIGAQTDVDRVLPVLQQILESHQYADVRDEAAEWLGKQHDRRALAPLVAATNGDASRNVQEEAVESIGELGSHAIEGAFTELVKIAEVHKDARVREEAVECIAEFNSPEAARALERIAMRDKSSSVQDEAVDGLAEMRPDLGSPILVALMAGHPSANIRGEVAEALADLPGDDAIVALKKAAMQDQSSSVRNEALEALAEMPGGIGISAVIDVAMNAPAASTKREAIELLGESKDPRARAALSAISGG